MRDDRRNPADGRHARRDRNNDAVIDAVIDFFHDGEPFPTAQQVADRAGVSLRSIYRYHPDLDALVLAAVHRFTDRIRPWIDFTPPHGRPLVDRIAYLVHHRVELYRHHTVPLAALLAREARDPRVRAFLEIERARMVGDLHDLFTPELHEVSVAERAMLIGAVHTSLLFEGYENLRRRHAMSDDDITNSYRLTLSSHFSGFLARMAEPLPEISAAQPRL